MSAAKLTVLGSPHIALGRAAIDLPNLAPGDAEVEPISLQNTGSVAMQLELTASTPADLCAAPACALGTAAQWLTFVVVDGSATAVWSGGLKDLEAGVKLNPVIGPGTTAHLLLTISLPTGTPNGGQGEDLEFTLSGTGVPVGPVPAGVLPPSFWGPTSGAGTGTGPTGSGPTGSGPTGTDGAPTVTIGQSADPAVVPAGGRVGFTIAVSNGGPTEIDGISLEDQLPDADNLGWSLVQPTDQSHVASGEGCALIGHSLSCSGLVLPPGADLSIQVQSTPVPLDCSQNRITNSAMVSVPGQPGASRAAVASLTCVLGESITGVPAPDQAAKAPIELRGALPFTGGRLLWLLAVTALFLVLAGVAAAVSSRVIVGRRPT